MIETISIFFQFHSFGSQLQISSPNDGRLFEPWCPDLVYNAVPGEPKMFTRLTGYGIKIIWQIFKTKMLIFQSKANLDEKIIFVKSLII